MVPEDIKNDVPRHLNSITGTEEKNCLERAGRFEDEIVKHIPPDGLMLSLFQVRVSWGGIKFARVDERESPVSMWHGSWRRLGRTEGGL